MKRKVMESLIRSNRIESDCQIMQMNDRAAYCDLANFAFRPRSCAAYQFNPQTYPPVPICHFWVICIFLFLNIIIIIINLNLLLFF